MPRRAYPASPPIYQDPEKLAEQVRRTDSALTSWRDVADERRQSWEVRRAAAEAEMRRRRRRVVGIACAVGLGATIAVVGLALTRPPAQAPLTPTTPKAPVATVAVTPQDAPRTEAEPARPPAPAFAAIAPEPPAPSVPVEPAPAPADAAPAGPLPPITPGALIEAGTGSVWSDDGRLWAGFQTRSTAALQLRYLDGAGAEALEPMGCKVSVVGGVRHCTAARSIDRVKHAIDGGAASGSWTVLGCSTEACEEIGRFDSP